MITFPNAKINIGLHVADKRADGFHNLLTIFYPLPFCDVLEIIGSPKWIFKSSGISIPGNADDNLCIRAYQLLKKDYPQIPEINMHLHKVVPLGAGLGGGSSDAAHTLLLLNKKFDLQLSKSQLMQYAAQLGSDCPFFIRNEPCLATGRGEILEPLDINLTQWHFLLINPGIHIPTAWAFSQLKANRASRTASDWKSVIQSPVETWKEELVNDFEVPVMQAHPAIAKIKAQLYDWGAAYASMSGSGSTVFGIFRQLPVIPTDLFPPGYLLKAF